MTQKVVVAMSGGVDSSVAAALLIKKGYEVIGIMLKLWAADCDLKENACCTPESISQARAVAAKLKIPFYVIDAKSDFKKKVVEQFIQSYQDGLTPNPCFACNQTIKWGFLLERAKQMGVELIATGHYAQIVKDHSGLFHLLKGADENKDQSYVLSGLTQEQLSRTLLPLGDLQKQEVRDFARSLGLTIADKPDSQDLCFVGKDGYRAFLQKYNEISYSSGMILSVDGKVLGEHHGLQNFTIGHRKGIGSGMGVPMYVVEKDAKRNVLIVGTKEQLGTNRIYAKCINWINTAAISEATSLHVKIRYKSKPAKCMISNIDNDVVAISLSELLDDVTPGQIAVIYNQNEVVGSAIILSSERVQQA